jgi:Bacterial extracellular solute-binding protein
VLIGPQDSKLDSVAIGPNLDLAKLAGDGSIAVADVREVPVGKYAKAALEKLGAWQAAAPKLAMAANTRVALTMVARGEAPLGIVYTTDANGTWHCGDRWQHCVENLNVLRWGPRAVAVPRGFLPRNCLSRSCHPDCEARSCRLPRISTLSAR